jgi:hypothetical protein
MQLADRDPKGTPRRGKDWNDVIWQASMPARRHLCARDSLATIRASVHDLARTQPVKVPLRCHALPRIILPLLIGLGAALPARSALPFSATGGSMFTSAPGVVHISTRTRVRVQDSPLPSDPLLRRFIDIADAPRERESRSLGSGMIVTADKGLILSRNRAPEKADVITVTRLGGVTRAGGDAQPQRSAPEHSARRPVPVVIRPMKRIMPVPGHSCGTGVASEES